MTAYPFRTTTKVSKTVYCEDRGFPYHIDINDSNFNTLNNEFGTLLNVGQTAVRSNDGTWEVIDEFPLLENAKENKYRELKDAFTLAESNSVVMSRVGFEINADERAYINIHGLLNETNEGITEKVSFCDANNEFHDVTGKQLAIMLSDVFVHRSSLYQRKWNIRSRIQAATTFDDLNKIEITFEV